LTLIVNRGLPLVLFVMFVMFVVFVVLVMLFLVTRNCHFRGRGMCLFSRLGN